MTVLSAIKEVARKLGIEVNWYTPVESDTARLFKQIDFHKVDTVFDVGANDGGYGRLLRRGGYGGAILSFEPTSDAYVKLLSETKNDATWQVAPRMALGSCVGEIEINISGNSTSSSILPMQALHESAAPQSRYVGTEKVAINRLDQIEHPHIRAGNSFFLKVDTQGYEMPVLEGASGLMDRVTGIQLELSLVPLYAGQILYSETIAWLKDNGFDLWSVMPGFVDKSSGRMLQMDGVFFRREAS